MNYFAIIKHICGITFKDWALFVIQSSLWLPVVNKAHLGVLFVNLSCLGVLLVNKSSLGLLLDNNACLRVLFVIKAYQGGAVCQPCLSWGTGIDLGGRASPPRRPIQAKVWIDLRAWISPGAVD